MAKGIGNRRCSIRGSSRPRSLWGELLAATDLLKLEYMYGSTANNGNVLTQTITVPTVGSNTGFAAVQTYSYDSLNRIHDAVENVTPTGGSASESWKQMFAYDRYGNRRFDESNTTMPTSFSNEAVTNPTISVSNNRLTSTGWGYDSSGNTTGDPQGRAFVYDGENRRGGMGPAYLITFLCFQTRQAMHRSTVSFLQASPVVDTNGKMEMVG